MNKQEVIDYVMNTPHNVNRTILSQSLDEIGTQADWNQSDPTKPDYVKNRTHYTETVNAIYEVDLAKDGIDGSNFEWGKPGFLYIETTEEIIQLFKDNWDKVVFTRSDGTIYKTVDMEKKSNIYSMMSISGDVTVGVNHTPNYTSNIGASVPGVLSVEYPKEVVHKIPEKYLPNGIGGGSGEEYDLVIASESGSEFGSDTNAETFRVVSGNSGKVFEKVNNGEFPNVKITHRSEEWEDGHRIAFSILRPDIVRTYPSGAVSFEGQYNGFYTWSVYVSDTNVVEEVYVQYNS